MKERYQAASASVFRILSRIVFGTTLIINALAFWMVFPNIGAADIMGWGFLGFPIIASLAFVIVGTLILNRHPHHVVGWLFSLVGWTSSLQALLQGYLVRYFLLDAGSPELGVFVAWILQWIWVPLVFGIILIPLFYPTGRLPSPRWRFFLLLSIVATLMGLFTIASQPGKLDNSLPSLDNPFGIGGYDGLFAIISIVFLLGWVAQFIGSAFSLVGRYRDSSGLERGQIKWFVYASVLLTLTAPLGLSGYLLGQLVFILAILFVPVAVGIAILQYRLWDIDLVIRRTLVYAALTLTLGLVYFGGVVSLQFIFTQLTGQGSPIAIVLSTLAIAALFTPLRQRLQSFIYRRKYDSERTLANFASVARDEVHMDKLTAELLVVVEETVQPEKVRLWLRESEWVGFNE